MILLYGFGSWLMTATTSHATSLYNSASIKAFCQAAQRELQHNDAPLTPEKLLEFSQNIGLQLGWHMVDHSVLERQNFCWFSFQYKNTDASKIAMNVMGTAIHWLAENDAQLVMMPLGSQNRDDWTAFFEAARQYPDILFIFLAGNNGRDLAQAAIYPAVNDLPNALTVTSTLADGRLPTDSNFGEVVDIGVPAEAMTATSIDYEERQV